MKTGIKKMDAGGLGMRLVIDAGRQSPMKIGVLQKSRTRKRLIFAFIA